MKNNFIFSANKVVFFAVQIVQSICSLFAMLIVAKFNKNIEKTVKVPQVPVTEMYNLYVSKDKMSYFCE